MILEEAPRDRAFDTVASPDEFLTFGETLREVAADAGGSARRGFALTGDEQAALLEEPRRRSDRLFEAARRSQQLVDNTNARSEALTAAYDRRRDVVRSVTGVSLENPEHNGFEREARAMWLQRLQAGEIDFTTYAESFARVSPDLQRRAFDAAVAELAAQKPEWAQALQFYQTPQEQARAIAGNAEAELTQARSTGPGGAAGFAVEGAASVLGSLSDPVTLASLALGAGPSAARSVVGQVTSVALREAAINAGVTALQQPVVQAWRRELGLVNGVEPAIENVGMAALIGGVFGGAVGGLQAALRRPEAVALADTVDRVLSGRGTAAEARQVIDTLGAPLNDDAGRQLDAAARVEAQAADLPPAPAGVAAIDHLDTIDDALRHAIDPDAPSPVSPLPAPAAPPVLADPVEVKRQLAAFKQQVPFTTIDSQFKAAPANQARLAAAADEIGARYGLTFTDPGIKTRESAARKLAVKGYVNASDITDIVRGGFNVRSPADADRVVADLRQRFEIIDEGWSETFAGYVDRKLIVRFPDGQLGEVQFWEPSLYKAKETGGGHALYERFRTLSPGAERDRALAEMQALYARIRSGLSDAWRGIGGNIGNEGNVASNASGVITLPDVRTSASSTSVQRPSISAKAALGENSTGSPSQVPTAQLAVIDRPSGGEALSSEPVRFRVLDRPVAFESVPATSLTTDALTFQYKSAGDAAGVTDRLRSVGSWDPLAAGKAVVYERSDGSRVIADGHQRLGLARRLLRESPAQDIRLDAYVFREADGWTPADVRAIAAKKNLQEGSGTLLDTARIIRDRPDLFDASLPLSDGRIQQAVGLARLSDVAWSAVINERVEANHAAWIGRQLPNQPELHGAIVESLVRVRPDSEAAARFAISDAIVAGFRTEVQETLFGQLETTLSLAPERARIFTAAMKRLEQDKRLFSVLTDRATAIEAAGNQLDTVANAGRRDTADRLRFLLEKLATRTGPVSDALNRAAVALAEGGRTNAVADRFTQDVLDLIQRDGLDALSASPSLRTASPVEPGSPAAAAQADALTPELQLRDPAVEPSFFDTLPQAATEGGRDMRPVPIAEALVEADKKELFGDLVASCKLD